MELIDVVVDVSMTEAPHELWAWRISVVKSGEATLACQAITSQALKLLKINI